MWHTYQHILPTNGALYKQAVHSLPVCAASRHPWRTLGRATQPSITIPLLGPHDGLRATANQNKLHATVSHHQQPPRISLLVPGYNGALDRGRVVEHNLQLLHNAAVMGDITISDCNIFVYKAETAVSTAAIRRILPSSSTLGCEFPRQVGFWAAHVRAHNVSAVRSDIVMVLIDSVEIDARTSDLRMLVGAMTTNCLGLVSPSCLSCPSKALIKPHREYNTSLTVGRLVEYADAQLFLMPVAVFSCWHELIDLIGLSTDPFGWTMGRYLPPYCGVRVGIVDAMLVVKRYTSATSAGRSGGPALYSWAAAAKSASQGHARIRSLMPGLKMGNSSRILGPLWRPHQPAHAVADAPQHERQHGLVFEHGNASLKWAMPRRCEPLYVPFRLRTVERKPEQPPPHRASSTVSRKSNGSAALGHSLH